MTPQYYVLKLTDRPPYADLASAQRAAESLDLSPGEEVAILIPIGITWRSVTTTWLGKQDIGSRGQSTSTPWSWPTLPPGHSYLNPQKFTVETLGDGWRPLCTLDESFPKDHEWRLDGEWIRAIDCEAAPRIIECPINTYRTRAPIPTLPSNP